MPPPPVGASFDGAAAGLDAESEIQARLREIDDTHRSEKEKVSLDLSATGYSVQPLAAASVLTSRPYFVQLRQLQERHQELANVEEREEELKGLMKVKGLMSEKKRTEQIQDELGRSPHNLVRVPSAPSKGASSDAGSVAFHVLHGGNDPASTLD